MLKQQNKELLEARLDRAVVDVGKPQITATERNCDDVLKGVVVPECQVNK